MHFKMRTTTLYFQALSGNKILTLTKKLTMCSRIQEMQFKIIHKIYASDGFISNFDNTIKKNFSECYTKNNVIHMFVECGMLFAKKRFCSSRKVG